MSSFSEIRERVIDKDNNVHLLRFLAKSGYGVRLSDLHYPIFTDSGNWIDSYKNLYLPNGLGKEFASQNWVGDDWLNFVDSSYFEIDHDVLKVFFESQGMDYYLSPDKIISPRKLECADKMAKMKNII